MRTRTPRQYYNCWTQVSRHCCMMHRHIVIVPRPTTTTPLLLVPSKEFASFSSSNQSSLRLKTRVQSPSTSSMLISSGRIRTVDGGRVRSSSTLPPRFEMGGIIVDEDAEGLSIMDREVDHDVDEHLPHLRTKLYDPEKDPTGTIAKIYEVASVQELLDIISECQDLNVTITSQALVSLWDMQKLLFQLSPLFSLKEDTDNKTNFVESVKQNEVFQRKILQSVMNFHTALEDEPLCASLLALRKLNYSMLEVEPLIEECLRRKDTLSLPGLSRLSVCLRPTALYPQCVMSQFSPLTLNYVQSMNEDLEVRLVSILLRNSVKVLSQTILQTYIQRVTEIINSSIPIETVTYCKIFLVLLEISNLPQAMPLLYRLGTMLAERVPSMELMELISLQRFLMGPFSEPYGLKQALIKRNLRIIEEEKDNPRVELLSTVIPSLREKKQKDKVMQITRNLLDTCDVGSVQNLLFPLIKFIKVGDRTLYDKYWNSIADFLESCRISDFKRGIQVARNYVNFVHSSSLMYRNAWLESLVLKYLYSLVDNYNSKSPSVILTPIDYAGIFSFLVAFDQTYLDLKYLSYFDNFASQMKPVELNIVAKGIDCALMKFSKHQKRLPSKSFEVVCSICTILEEECSLRFLDQPNDANLDNVDVAAICRILAVIRKLKGDSPLVASVIRTFHAKSFHGPREIRELINLLFSSSYLDPHTMEAIANYVFDNLEYLTPETVERFLSLSYCLGWENDKFDFSKLASVIEKYSEELNLGVIASGTALGFHRQLRPELINKIFNVGFLDYIDNELVSNFSKGVGYAQRLREQVMKLNRLICLDVPDIKLPWFHEKFCQNLISQGFPKPTYLHNEVQTVLNELIGEGVVQSNVCLASDYYYLIDFVLKFDKLDRPIKTMRPKSFFSRTPPIDDSNVKRKVAILVHPNSAYTKNSRSLKGGKKLQQRHLEILGYHVVAIDPFHWNSLYMTEPTARQHFLESKIFDTPV